MMPHYRGVDRDAICDSLTRAQAFLDGFAIDPDELPVKWDAASAIERLRAVDSDLALAHAMIETRTAAYFQPFYHFFGHYALADKAPDAMHLYHDLSRWGAFDVSNRHQFPRSLAAMVAADLAKSFESPDFQDGSVVHHRLRAAFAQAACNNESLNRVRERMLVDFLVKAQTSPGSETQRRFQDLRQDEQDYTLRILRQAKGYDYKMPLLEGSSPFGFYCLVVENLPVERRKDFILSVLEPVRETIGQTLRPYTERGDILGQRHGLLAAGGPGGYVLVATRAAAQALADCLPEWSVIDREERRLPPSSPPLSPPPSSPPPSSPGPAPL